MKIFHFVIFIVLCSNYTIGQQRKSFSSLWTGNVNHYEEATFSIDSTSSILFNGYFNELQNKPKGFNLEDFECEINSTILAIVTIDKKTNRQALLTFGICPEFEFYLYDLNTKKIISSFYALNIVIPGNGSIYCSGHLNDFNVKSKYSYDGIKFKEIKQPYYYVGLKSNTLQNIQIFTDKQLTEKLALIPKGYEIEVLLADQPYNNEIYLVKTSFGLIGWTKLKSAQYKSIDVEGLFYNND